jgi:hypothetical protein
MHHNNPQPVRLIHKLQFRSTHISLLPSSHWNVKKINHAPGRIFRIFPVSVKKSPKIGPSNKCYEIWWVDSSYYSTRACKKPHQNSISRYHFTFLRILRFLATLKIYKKFIPWRKITKLGGQGDFIFISMPAKNLVKIRPIGRNLALCLLRKKVSTGTKLAIAY